MNKERSKNEDIAKDIEKLKKDMNKFRDDITDTLSDMGTYSHEKVLQTRNRLKNAVAEFEGIASEKLEHANQVLHEQGEKWVHESRTAISKRPLTTVAASFAAGLLTAYLMHRNKHE